MRVCKSRMYSIRSTIEDVSLFFESSNIFLISELLSGAFKVLPFAWEILRNKTVFYNGYSNGYAKTHHSYTSGEG